VKKFVLLCTTAMLPSAVFAQSTGTATFENQSIVVTGTRAKDVGGVKVTDTTKARNVLTQEFIARQQPGQSIDDIINYLPGVNFQSNGPYGDAGGTLTIHGFDASRISQTFDGVPMNDSGNYALFSQEQLDPELISEVNVTTGSTDLDSPTASATGGTVNYVLRDPTENMHLRVQGSLGSFAFRRFFGVFDTGALTPFGTRVFFAASNQKDHNPYDPSAKINKTQLNGKIYQPLGGDDFVSLNAFYVRNRGQKFNDVTLATFPSSSTTSVLTPPPCKTTPAVAGHADVADPKCGLSAAGYFGYGRNPASIFRLHLNSRLSIAPGLTVTLEPNYEHTEANGGGAVIATESNFLLGAAKTPIFGYIGGKPYFGGVDLNGDGDTKDTVLVDAPSNTVTSRYGIIANLIYRMSDTQQFRINYTLDHARLRQTGEVGPTGPDGRPLLYFPANGEGIRDATGNPIEKRNRLSYSILNQVSGEYRGEFLDKKLVIDLGLRAPFFSRKLTNHCVAESTGSGFVDCFNNAASQTAFLAAHQNDAAGPYQPPQSRNLKYNRVLPSAGLTYRMTSATQLFFNFSEGLQVPSTDALYDAFAFPVGTDMATPKAELSKNFEGGGRYNSSKIKAQVSGWYTAFHNRISESLISDPQNPGQFVNVYTNLGNVNKYGVDASIAYAPVRQLTLYAFGSAMHSRIQSDVSAGACSASDVSFSNPAGGLTYCSTVGQPIIFQTGGKQESASPTFTVGGRAQGNFGPLEVGIQAKRTGPRYVNDQNTGIFAFPKQPKPPAAPVTNPEIFPAKTPAYTLVDLDARVSLSVLGLSKHSFFQLNVHNLFDKFYVSGFSGTIPNSSFKSQFVFVGAPRSVTGSINVEF
jgi:iron complex outermembrane receptor protein